jgi:Mrp family chromosome partitioning ATPase
VTLVTLPASLDVAIEAALGVASGGSIPGFVKPTGESLHRPLWEQHFFESCRRALQTLISGPDDRGVLQVCSAGPTDGRSAVAAAMAVSLGRTYGEPVALLDADFTRTGDVAQVFGVDPAPGLADWLEHSERLRVVAGGSNRQLYLLPAGRHYRDPAWLYRDIVQRQVVPTFLQHFRWVVMDLPPLMVEPAGAQLLSLGGWHVLVGRYRHTTMRDLEEAAELLRGSPATGFLLTGETSRVPAWLRRLI